MPRVEPRGRATERALWRMVASDFDRLLGVARSLIARFHDVSEPTYFTRVPLNRGAHESLKLVDGTDLSRGLRLGGEMINQPTEDWYVPIRPIRASRAGLHSASVTVSVWEPPLWGGMPAAELLLRFELEDAGVKANQVIAVHCAASGRATISRYVYDQQRAETGYDGERRSVDDATPTEIAAMIEVVRQLTE